MGRGRLVGLSATIFALAACGGTSAASSAVTPAGPPTSSDHPGAATPRLAIEAFMIAVKGQNLDELALIWGSERGPARDLVDANQLRKREMIMQCHFQHDSYQILSDVETSSSSRSMTISVTKGTVTRETKTLVLLGPKARWYVASPDLAPLKDICSERVSQ
jgi:hypothetical protein